MRRSALALFLVMAAARGARGADAFGWRDGCPAGNRQTEVDLKTDPHSIAPYAGTDARAVGMAPELDSALVPTRLVVAPLFMHFPRADAGSADETNRLRMVGVKAQIDERVFFATGTAIGVAISTAQFDVLSGDLSSNGQPTPAPHQFGNVVVAVSVQHYWTASANVPEEVPTDGPGKSVHDPFVAGLRKGWSLRLAIAPTPIPNDIAGAATIFQRTAFDGPLFDPNRLVDGSFETRVEGVGCYAPFLHLRLRLMGGNDLSGRHVMLLAPETLAAGLTAAPNVTVMFQYGALFSSNAQLDTNRVHRFRFGAEFAGTLLSAGFHLDAYLGSRFYEGTAFELYLSLTPRIDG